jgi:hypothetical protein
MAAGAAAQVQSRIAGEINNEVRVPVQGTTSLIRSSVDTGRMTSGQNLGRMLLMLAPSAAQDQAAKKFVDDLHNPLSPSYHHWLTPAEFGRKFGVSDQDAASVQQWLQGQGLTVHEVAQSRRFIVFSGTVDQVERTFSTEMHTYSLKGNAFVANSTEIKIPAALTPVVRGVVRLSSEPSKPQAYVGGKVHRDPKTGQFEGGAGDHYLAPADFATIYNLNPLYQAGIDGTGQTIAIVGRSNIDVSNVTAYRSIFGLPTNDPQVIVNGDDPGQTGDMPEAMLDVTWSGAVAPKATILLVVSQSNFSDGVDVSASYIVDHNLAPVMSTSFGQCESTLGSIGNAFYYALWQQAAAQGITPFVSAGDNGGAGCDAPDSGTFAFNGLAVNGLASTPYNVAVGGTQFEDTTNPTQYWATTNDPTTNASALSYIPEQVWNESSNDPNGPVLWAGSGGVSSLYKKPDWQSAAGVPNDGMRDLPDISLTASIHDGYLVCMFSNCSYGDYFYYFGGTSASSPAAAGIMALVNQKLGGSPQGVANYVFYRLSSTSGVFHDTTNGNNMVPDPTGQYTVGYNAGPGYDLASGLGSFDANALVNNWSSVAAGTGSSISLTLPGQSKTAVHGTPLTFQAKVHCSGAGCTAPSGSVSLLATSGTASLGMGAGTLSPSSPSSIVNIVATAVPGGSQSVSARYGGDGTYTASTSNAVSVTITPETSQSFVGAIGGGVFTIAPIEVGYGLPLRIGGIVAGNSGAGHPSGQLLLTVDGVPATTVTFDPSTSIITPSSLTLNYGENSGILLPTVSTISQSSTVSYLPPTVAGSTQRFPAGPHIMQFTYPGDASFAASTSNSYTFTVLKADTFIGDFFPLGTQVANIPVHLEGQIGFKNQGYATYGGTITITDTTSGTPVVLGSGPLNPNYGGSYDVPVTVTTAGNNQCGPSYPGVCHVLVVSFSGDHDTNPSTGTYYVPFPATSSNVYLNLSADLTNAIAGAAVTLTAQVQTDVRGYIPTGTVTFYDGTTSLGASALDATGTATLVVKTFAAGTHSSITAAYSGDSVLTSTTGGPIIENVSDYTVQATPASITVQAGVPGTSNLSVLPIGGSTQTVQFSCGTLPANLTCTFSPTSVTLDGIHPGSMSVTISTGTAKASSTTKPWLWGAASTVAFGFLLVPFRRRKQIRATAGTVVLLVIAIAGVGCGSSSTPSKNASAGTYVVNLTANGGTGSAAKSIPLVVTVQ